jgi:ribonuclease HII
VYPRRIEKLNIARAANAAALRAFARLSKTCNLQPKTCRVYLDGGLYLGNGRHSANSERPTAKTIVRGDEKLNAVKIASILAKVSRDRLMARLAKKHPAYGFEVHKGYGTRAHLAAIKRHGLSEAHRRGWV